MSQGRLSGKVAVVTAGGSRGGELGTGQAIAICMAREGARVLVADIETENAEAYMCGPPGMIDAGIATLTENGVQLSSIHYDKFTDQSHSAKMS